MSERRYGDDEVRRIFELAADRQEQARSAASRGGGEGGDGLTLAELQEIGAAAGIDPDHVVAAAEGLAAGGALARRPVTRGEVARAAPSGQPLLLESRSVPRIDDAIRERLVDVLRREYRVAGISGQVGRVREWARDADTKKSTPPTVRVIPGDDRDVLEVSEGTEQLFLVPKILGGVFAGNAALIGLLMLLGTSSSGPPVALPLAFALLGALIFGVGMAIARVAAGRRADRLSAVADRLALIAAEADRY